MADVPNFMNGINDDPERAEINDVLNEDPYGPNQDPESKDEGDSRPVDGEGDDSSEDNKSEENGDGGDKKAEDGGEGDGDKSERGKTEDKTPDNKGDKQPTPEPKKEEPKKEENLILGKYKTVEEAEQAQKELAEALNSVRQPKQPDQFDEELKQLIGGYELQMQMPNPEFYYIDGEDGSKTFDLGSFMNDYTRNLTKALVPELLGGQLAAAQFGILQRALGEHSEKTREEAQKEEEANSILTRITDKFPILSTDEKAQEKMERAIYGEAMRRQNIAKAEGKEFEGLKYEDYEALALDIIGEQPAPPAQEEEPTEKPKGSPTYSERRNGADDDMEKDIDDMMKVSQRRSIF